MTKIIEHQLDSFSKIMNLIEKFQDGHEFSWYRGVGNSNHSLTPSLFRHPLKKDAEALHRLEKDISSVFSQRSPPFVSQVFEDEWEKMFYMQHYGIPTRLLDWTESPFIALYFALTSCSRKIDGTVSAPVSIWLLDPSEWNKVALSDISFEGDILDSRREQVKSYSPKSELEERKNTTVMIYGTHNSPRIVAQRGMFALFGKNTASMNDQFFNGSFKKDTLQKVNIPAESVDKIAKSLFRKGIADSTVYPDLHGLALEMRRQFAF